MGFYRNNNGVIENLTPTAPPAIGIQYDNSTTGLPTTTQRAIDKTTDNIASANSVELAATAAHTHAVGTYFIWIGQFVKVTSAIAVGDTIADGTNVEATSIADVLAAANGAIEGKLSPSDVINNLTSTATDCPLSAAMGKALNDGLNNKINKTEWLYNTDLNQVKTTGLYLIGLGNINAPTNDWTCDWSALTVIGNGAEFTYQIFHNRKNRMFKRNSTEGFTWVEFN